MSDNKTIDLEENYFEEVGFANDFKEAVEKSSIIKFENKDLKDKLLNFEDDVLVVLKSEINSPKKIIFVESYNKYVESF